MHFLAFILIFIIGSFSLASTKRASAEDCFQTNGIDTITKYLCAGKDGGQVVIPNTIQGMTVLKIGKSAFSQLSLASVEIPEGVKIIERSAFAGNEIKDAILPDSLTSIGEAAFKDNLLGEVKLPAGLATIAFMTFSNNKLVRLVIPNGVETIDAMAFMGNALAYVEIPRSVTSIGIYAFMFNNLATVTVPHGALKYETCEHIGYPCQFDEDVIISYY